MSAATNPVIVYSTTWCAYCKMLKAYLSDKCVEWVEKDIEADPAAHAEEISKNSV